MKDGTVGDTDKAMLVDGIIAGTRIATATGWRAVQTLRPGDTILTLESGLQPLCGLRSVRLPGGDTPPAFWPVLVPPGALDCREPVLLLPHQRVGVECDEAEVLYGDPLALVPAAALQGWRGIARVPHAAGDRAVLLRFAAPQVVYASRAVLLAVPGPAAQGAHPASLLTGAPRRLGETGLTYEQARHLVACLMAEDLGGAWHDARA